MIYVYSNKCYNAASAVTYNALSSTYVGILIQ